MDNGARKNKIVVILGLTSSGKSDIAIKLAKKFGGEIISADSRQIYRGLDIGTGKIKPDPHPPTPSPACGKGWLKEPEEGKFYSEGIPHYAIDIVNPKTDYNAAKFKKYTDKVITDILRRKKLPIICGGTGFWIKAIIDNVNYPEVKPDWLLRNKLCNKSARELFDSLKKLDPKRVKTIDRNNTVRLIRAIEICKAIGKVPSPSPQPSPNYGRGGKLCPSLLSGEMSRSDREEKNCNYLQIGLSLPKEKLHANIKKRLKKRFEAGMIEEVGKLHYKNKISWKHLESFGLGYKLIPQYLRGEISSEKELFEKIFQAEKNYAKRQMTWFKKDKRIHWIKKYSAIESKVKNFL